MVNFAFPEKLSKNVIAIIKKYQIYGTGKYATKRQIYIFLIMHQNKNNNKKAKTPNENLGKNSMCLTLAIKCIESQARYGTYLKTIHILPERPQKNIHIYGGILCFEWEYLCP